MKAELKKKSLAKKTGRKMRRVFLKAGAGQRYFESGHCHKEAMND
jgi:hypothetical protein